MYVFIAFICMIYYSFHLFHLFSSNYDSIELLIWYDYSLFIAGKCWVNAPADFSFPSICPILLILAATDHLTTWYATDECYLFDSNSILLEFFTTFKLWHKTFAKTLIGTPNILNLKLSVTICSMHVPYTEIRASV